MTKPVVFPKISINTSPTLNPSVSKKKLDERAVPFPSPPSLPSIQTKAPVTVISAAPAPRLESLLERFSAEKPQPKSLNEKISKVLAPIFEALRSLYQYISQIWGGISRSEEKLLFDLALLQEICGSPIPGAITQLQALRYIDEMLQRERDELRDPSLHDRIKRTIELIEKISHLHQADGASFKKTVQLIQQQIDHGEEMLLPVGFTGEPMLLEIKKQQDGTYSVALISTSSMVRDYFDREEDVNTSTQSIRREIIRVQKNDLLAAIPVLLELQITQKKESADLFFQILQFPGSTIIRGELTETAAYNKHQGLLRETLRAFTTGSAENQRFDLALRLRTFLDLSKGPPERMKDIRFWRLMRTAALQLSSLIEKEKHLLGSEAEQTEELSRIYHELKTVIDRLEAFPPKTLEKTSAQSFSGSISLKKEPETPPLKSLQRTPTIYTDIDPPFVPLDPNQPLVSIKSWASSRNSSTRLRKRWRLTSSRAASTSSIM